MIYTVTLNPTIDRTMHFPGLTLGTLNRAVSSRMDFSGKGVNVSMGLHQFGLESVIMGIMAGASGRIFEQSLKSAGYSCDCLHLEGETRSNITVVDDATGVTTKLNEPGPTVTEEDLATFEQRLLSRVREGDLCVFSGSLPPGAPSDTYAHLIGAVHSQGAKAALDTSGEALKLGCAAGPELLKPNEDEAVGLLSRPLESDEELASGLEALLALGPQRVLLSLGGRGAALADGDSIQTSFDPPQSKRGSKLVCWLAKPPAITEVSAVGAGDALMAAGLWAWIQGLSAQETVRWAVAAGTAAAMGDGSVMPELAHIREVYKETRVACLWQERVSLSANNANLREQNIRIGADSCD